MSSAANWRDSSNWRSGGGDPRASATAKQSRPGQELSWRAKDARLSEARAPRDRKNWLLSGSRPYDREQQKPRPHHHRKDEEGAARAIAEGRRIYIGNLRYQAKPDDLEGLLTAHALGNFDSIHISIDPFTGRNPSYCFVEFPDRASADRAMAVLEGKLLLGREVKCRPCQPKGSGSGGRRNEGLNRWGNWPNGNGDADVEPGEIATPDSQQDARDGGAPPSFARYREDFTGRRLYVGGLPRMLDQAANFTEMSELFRSFKVEAISKRVSAHASARAKSGRHDYCFVDFATPREAKAAVAAADGRSFRGGRLKVSLASGRSNKWQEREELDDSGVVGRMTTENGDEDGGVKV
ncbi:RNA-binding domain-containing protein [Xylariaceae sp. FL0662B]|nr:RNA-binding domain-containing protein [Xylariaceae sp. FL0662B]